MSKEAEPKRTITGPGKGRLTAAWSPGSDTTHWYPIEAMTWRHLPVVVGLHRGGTEVLAVVRRRGSHDWWFQLGAWGGEAYGWLQHEEIALEAYGRARPARNSPVKWQPVDPVRFPHRLPEPLPSAFGARQPAERPDDPVESLDPFLSHDGWPNPGVVLTRDAPHSRDECEARVLRAFRTSASRAGGGPIGHRTSELCSDIPSEIVKSALRFATYERLASRDRGPDDDLFEAVRSAWTPTKRDIADWVDALGWLSGMEPRARRILRLRAADPPWSFNQIARALRASPGTVRAEYQRALDVVYSASRRGGGSRECEVGNRSAQAKRSGA